MSVFAFSQLFVCFVPFFFLEPLNGVNLLSGPQVKRSDGLLHDLLDLMVDEREERNKLRQEVRAVKKNLEDLTKRPEKRRQNVAFTARLGSHSQFASNAVMKFDHVITNIGSGYNASDGVFYCPVDGVYIFDISLTGNAFHHVDAYLVKNGNNVNLFLSQINDDKYPTATASFALALKVGDKVWVKCRQNDTKYHIHSFFTGYLISHD